MKRLSMQHLVAGALLLFPSIASSQAYGRATIRNYALVRANVVVKYAACRTDAFVVSQGRASGDTVIAGVNEAPTRRGACLITSITATLEGDTATVLPYLAGGTSYSQFLLAPALTVGREVKPLNQRARWELFSKQKYKTLCLQSTTNKQACDR
ncbi:MAG: hypothetical protein H7247_12395 [Polaromonas sp.]|nr:hypothetical protein [Gemmatimonadaceae bacterium]